MASFYKFILMLFKFLNRGFTCIVLCDLFLYTCTIEIRLSEVKVVYIFLCLLL